MSDNKFQFFPRSRNKDGSLRKERSDKGKRRVPLKAEQSSSQATKRFLNSQGAQRIKNGIDLRLDQEKEKLNQSVNGVKTLLKKTFPSNDELKELVEEEKKTGTLLGIAKQAGRYAAVTTATLGIGLALHKNADKFGELSKVLTRQGNTPFRKVKAFNRLNRIKKTERALDKADALMAQASMKRSGLNVSLRPDQLAPRATKRAATKAAFKLSKRKAKKSKEVQKRKDTFARKTGLGKGTTKSLLKKARAGDRDAQTVLRSQSKNFKKSKRKRRINVS